MQETDLKFLLRDYADRMNSAYIESDIFFRELSTMAFYKVQKDRAWEVWTRRPREKFDTDLEKLENEGFCYSKKEAGKAYIYMPAFFLDRVHKAWEKIELREKNIFPDEKAIKTSLPADVLKIISSGDLVSILRAPQDNDLPILQVNFSGKLGTMFTLYSFLSSILLDAAVSKMRMALLNKENRGFCLSRLQSLFPDKVSQANKIIDAIVKNPITSVILLRESDEGGAHIWGKLCELVRESIISGNAPPVEQDLAAAQGAEIIGIYNNHFSELAAKKNIAETHLRYLYDKMSAPPYFWTFTEIYKIIVENDKSVIELVNYEEVNDYILKKSSDFGDVSAQPPLLAFYNEYKEKCFIKKELVFKALDSLIKASSAEVRKSIYRRWSKLLKEYHFEAATHSEIEFETLVIKAVRHIKPFVMIIYQDIKLKLLRREYSANNEALELCAQFFSGDDLKPLKALYNMDRKSILKDVKLSLPFWYSIPLFVFLLKLFKGHKHIDKDYWGDE